MKDFLTRSRVPLVIIALMLPLVVGWALVDPLANGVPSGVRLVAELGQIVGLIGAFLFATALILSARIGWIEKVFNGLNHVYLRHHRTGSLAFILLMVHPLLLMVQHAQISSRAAAEFFVPSLADLPRTLGILALALLMFLLVLTIYAKLRYQVWKFSHRFLGVVFGVGVLHYVTTAGLGNPQFFRVYLMTYSLVALGVYVFKVVLGPIFTKHYSYQVTNVRALNNDVVEISLQPNGSGMRFEPGQFLFVSFDSAAVDREEHPFSISSAPEEKELRVTVKNLGDYTARLKNLQVGDNARVAGPHGAFVARRGRPQQIWIAGGIGVTPFVGMAKALPKPIEANLYYVTKNETEAPYAEDLVKLSQLKPNFKFQSYFSEQSGRFRADALKEREGDLTQKSFYICGPVPMMASLRKQLQSAGVSADQIITEEFGLYEATS